MKNNIKIDHHEIGHSKPAFLIAEAGVNHNGDIDMAKKLIHKAKQSGADCIKFQTFKAERVVTQNAPKANYQLHVTDPQESQLDMLKKLELPENVYAELIEKCESEELVFTSTPYNEEDIDFLVALNVPVLKSASIHIAEPRFLQRMAETGKPMIVSTGMATWQELESAVAAIRSTGNEQFVLLQCTTNYPSLIEDTNLRAMVAMEQRFNCLTGYSDHTQSHTPCLGAIALGACIIEKHFTLDKNLDGPDHSTSETPEGFASLVRKIRELEAALGSSNKSPTKAEIANMSGMRRSIAARRELPAGHTIGDEDLTAMRPSSGIPPGQWNQLIGKTLTRSITVGEFLSWADLDD